MTVLSGVLPARRWAARAATALVLSLVASCVAIGLGAVGRSDAANTQTTYFALPGPQRLADTRDGTGYYQRIDALTIRVPVLNRTDVTLPGNAAAAVLNVTAVLAQGPTHVTVYPSGSPTVPTVSNLNLVPGQTVANMATVRLGADGAVILKVVAPTALIVDVSGVYVPVPVGAESRAGRLIINPDGAKRVLDTRELGYYPGPGAVVNVPIAIPAYVSRQTSSVSAVVVNVTGVQAGVGHYTVYPGPYGRIPPNTSTLNFDAPGQIRAGQAIVKIDGPGSINVFTFGGGHVVVDVVGFFTGAGAPNMPDGRFIPREGGPIRLGDTRDTQWMPLWGGSTWGVNVQVPSDTRVAGVAINVTMTQTLAAGHVTAYPWRVARPDSSTINASGWDVTIANHAIVAISSGVDYNMALFTISGSHLIADLAGWYVGYSVPQTQPPPTNPNYSANPAANVWVNDMPCTSLPRECRWMDVVAGQAWELDWIADQGWAAAYETHNYVATAGNVMLFAHRTTDPEPLYYIDRIPYGSVVSLRGSDGHWYDYVVISKDITPPDAGYIDQLARDRAGGLAMTVQLIACHPLHKITQRYVVTARFIGVRP